MNEATISQESSQVNSREVRRLIILKIFSIIAIVNNGFIAFTCFMQNGGSLFQHAPAWTVTAFGSLGVATMIGAALVLAWKKIGVYTVVAAGLIAMVVSAVSLLWVWVVMFALGTAFMAMLAKHLWHRFA